MGTKAIVELSYDEILGLLSVLSEVNDFAGLTDDEEEIYNRLLEVGVEMRQFVDFN